MYVGWFLYFTFYLTGKKAAQSNLKKQFPGNEFLQNALSPNYLFGCKRICPSNDYYPALALPHVKLHRRKFVRVESDTLCTEDGRQKIDVTVKIKPSFN
jgi:cyclohexanone monooxygenase